MFNLAFNNKLIMVTLKKIIIHTEFADLVDTLTTQLNPTAAIIETKTINYF